MIAVVERAGDVGEVADAIPATLMDLEPMSNPRNGDMNHTKWVCILQLSPMGLNRSSGSKRAGSPVLNPNAMLGHNIKRPQMGKSQVRFLESHTWVPWTAEFVLVLVCVTNIVGTVLVVHYWLGLTCADKPTFSRSPFALDRRQRQCCRGPNGPRHHRWRSRWATTTDDDDGRRRGPGRDERRAPLSL